MVQQPTLPLNRTAKKKPHKFTRPSVCHIYNIVTFVIILGQGENTDAL